LGKSAGKKKVPLPIRTIVPKAKLKNKAKPTKTGVTPKARRNGHAEPPTPPADRIRDTVLDRLYDVVVNRRDADPAVSHSARLMSRGITKVAQKFGEEAVECLIEAVAGNHDALVAESADVLYHLLVLWVASDVRPEQVWEELARRAGVSGIAEKASRPTGRLAMRVNTSKIP
jgi:phosphoribosyl-ATP pyrophosphohydrolase